MATPGIYTTSLALLTDLYEITMAYSYWKSGIANRQAVFAAFFREHPFGGGYTIAAGLDPLSDWIESLRFDDEDRRYLAGLEGDDARPLFEPAFLDELAGMEFACDVDAVPEGRVVFPHEPMVRVRGPILQCQILETAILNLVNFQSLIATKASRVVAAAGPDPVVEFGLRRAQGIDGGLAASRAAYIGGCAATSNVLAGKVYGIPVKGTLAHSWVMCFDDETEAFETYARAMPNNCVFLVDTYDSLDGVRHAIEAGRRLRAQGHRMVGVRLDSGDLAYLSIQARRMLDEAGFGDAVILASNNLDESIIRSLKEQGAAIGVWGVGTKLATAFDEPALGGVYKLTAVRPDPAVPWTYRIKLSEQLKKASIPGLLQIRRFRRGREFVADAIYDEQMGLGDSRVVVDPGDATRRKPIPSDASGSDLLVPVFRSGKRVLPPAPLDEIRRRRKDDLDSLHPGIRRFVHPHEYPAGLAENLFDLRSRLIIELKNMSRGGARGSATRGGDALKALILVDLQNDFLPGGALGVPEGDRVIPVANRIQERFDLVVATRDWHPPGHASFATNHPGRRPGEWIDLDGAPQVLWPPHCVQDSPGARLAPGLDTTRIRKFFFKGTDESIDSYSAFFDNRGLRSTGLGDYLREQDVDEVYLMGLATDYCVKYSALDAVGLGFRTTVIEDGCRGIELNEGDIRKAIDEMREAGVRVVTSRNLLE